MKIDELCGCAWDTAIRKTAAIINNNLGLRLTLSEWLKIQELAYSLGINYDVNGNIQR